jgi:uncharacterized protein
MNRLDPRSPLVFDTTALGRRPGTMDQVSRTVEAPSDFGTDVIAVKEGQPVELDLRLESVVEGVLVTGSASAVATGACVRCLDPVSHRVDVRFQELFAYADRAAHLREVGDNGDEAEEYQLVEDLFDLEPVLLDAVVPSLPFKPVCRDDCPGLCSECGARLADDPGHHHEVIDPRWAALTALTTDTESNTEEKRN